MIKIFTKISIPLVILFVFNHSGFSKPTKEASVTGTTIKMGSEMPGIALGARTNVLVTSAQPVNSSNTVVWSRSGTSIPKLTTRAAAKENLLSSTNRKFTVKLAVDPPTATGGTSCGPGAVTLTASGGTEGNYRWYTTATGGTAISGATGSTYITPVLTTTTTYYVTVVSGEEESARKSVTATINEIPQTPGVPEEFIVCQGSATIPLPETANLLKWYTTATGGTALESTPTFSTVTPGTTIYYVSLNLNGCESARVKITYVVVPLPASPFTTNTTICTGETAVLTASGAAAGESYRWYNTSTGGTAISGATGSTFTTPALTANTTYYVSVITSTGCEGPRKAVGVTVSPVIANNTIAGEQTLCTGITPAPVTGSTPSGGNGTFTYLWEMSTDGLTFVPASGVNNTLNYAPGVLSATTWFRRSITSSCQSVSNAVKITVAPLPATPVANDITICTGQAATVSVSAPEANATYRWYTTASGGTSVFTGTAYTTPNLTTNTMYYVEAVNAAGCLSARDMITVSVNAMPAAPTVTNVQRCGAGSVALQASGAPAGAGYRWYTEGTGGTAISGATGATFNTPNITTTTTYYVAVVNGTDCEGPRTAVTATINPMPTAPVVTAGFTYCQGATAPALTATGESLQWYTTATDGTATATAPTPTTTTAGATDYYVSQTVNGCESERSKITVTVTAAPTVSLAAFTAPVCSTITNFALTGGQPAGGTFSGPGVTNGVFNATTAGVGTHTITYTYTENGCSASATQTITVTTCTGLPESKLATKLMLYPNPTHTKLQITLPLPVKTSLELTLMDAKGQSVLKQRYDKLSGEFNRVLDLKGQAKGIYILQLMVEDGVITKRVVLD